MNSLDIFGHHMHGETSSYGILKDEKNYKNINNYLETLKKEDRPIQGINHVIDYVKLREAVPKEFNLIFNDTPHLCKERKLNDIIYNDIKKKGGFYREFPKHIYFEIDGKKAVVINSSEVTVKNKDKGFSEFTVTGLKQGYQDYNSITLDELIDLSKEAEITSPSHPYMPLLSTEEETLYDFLDNVKKEEDINGALNYSTGYFSLLNKISRGDFHAKLGSLEKIINNDFFPKKLKDSISRKKDVVSLAREYNLPLLPEVDSHAFIPNRLEGFGVLKSSVMEDFEKGDFPTKKLFDSEIICYKNKEGISFKDFTKTFSDIYPGWNYEKGPFKKLREKLNRKFLNYSYNDYKEVFEESLNSLNEMDIDEVINNTYNPLS